MSVEIVRLDADRAPEVTDVLCASFYDYPVMRFVLGASDPEYDRRLRTLIHFFVMARVHRGETMLGIPGDNGYAAVALLSRPTNGESPPELAELRDRTWTELGADERARYESFGGVCATFEVRVPHIHLNMIGVRPGSQGLGLGRRLLEHVHALSAEDGSSEGVTLTTESPSNVPLYEHFGYSIVGHARVAPELETWSFFRPD